MNGILHSPNYIVCPAMTTRAGYIISSIEVLAVPVIITVAVQSELFNGGMDGNIAKLAPSAGAKWVSV